MAAEAGSVSSASRLARAGSRAASATAGSSITATSIMRQVSFGQKYLSRKIYLSVGRRVMRRNQRTVVRMMRGGIGARLSQEAISMIVDRNRLVTNVNVDAHESPGVEGQWGERPGLRARGQPWPRFFASSWRNCSNCAGLEV